MVYCCPLTFLARYNGLTNESENQMRECKAITSHLHSRRASNGCTKYRLAQGYQSMLQEIMRTNLWEGLLVVHIKAIALQKFGVCICKRPAGNILMGVMPGILLLASDKICLALLPENHCTERKVYVQNRISELSYSCT